MKSFYERYKSFTARKNEHFKIYVKQKMKESYDDFVILEYEKSIRFIENKFNLI